MFYALVYKYNFKTFNKKITKQKTENILHFNAFIIVFILDYILLFYRFSNTSNKDLIFSDYHGVLQSGKKLFQCSECDFKLLCLIIENFRFISMNVVSYFVITKSYVLKCIVDLIIKSDKFKLLSSSHISDKINRHHYVEKSYQCSLGESFHYFYMLPVYFNTGEKQSNTLWIKFINVSRIKTRTEENQCSKYDLILKQYNTMVRYLPTHISPASI